MALRLRLAGRLKSMLQIPRINIDVSQRVLCVGVGGFVHLLYTLETEKGKKMVSTK